MNKIFRNYEKIREVKKYIERKIERSEIIKEKKLKAWNKVLINEVKYEVQCVKKTMKILELNPNDISLTNESVAVFLVIYLLIFSWHTS